VYSALLTTRYGGEVIVFNFYSKLNEEKIHENNNQSVWPEFSRSADNHGWLRFVTTEADAGRSHESVPAGSEPEY
jgi:hypothetical protein